MKLRPVKFFVFVGTLLLSLLITSLMLSYFKAQEMDRNDELIQAAWAGNGDRMKMLVEAGADVNFNETAHPGCIPLTCAARQGHLSAVQFLLDSNADLELIDDSHRTALMWAAENGHFDVAQLLVSKGANVNAVHFNDTALRLAVMKRDSEIIKLLKQAGAKE